MQQTGNIAPDRPKYLIDLMFACEELPNLDVMTLTDAFLIVYEKLPPNRWNKIGQTEVVYNNLRPEFNKSFTVDFFFEDRQDFKVEVYHHNSETENVYIGEVEFVLSQLMGRKDDILEKDIEDKRTHKAHRGKLLARFDKSIVNCDVKLSIFGHSLHKRHWCGSNNNFLEIFKPKESAFREKNQNGLTEGFNAVNLPIPDHDWVLVHRSDFINKNEVCNWKEFSGKKSKLATGNENLPLKINVMDYMKNNGNHKLVGTTMKTIAELKQAFDAKSLLEITKDGKGKRGYLSVQNYTEKTTHDFLDYLKGGVNIALHLAIDFTASNKFPNLPDSLHHFNPAQPTRYNPYQQAILSAAEVLLDYDTDKMVPVYGFGADLNFPNLKSTGVSHVFPCTGNPNADEVPGLQGIFDVYTFALKHVKLNGPTHFAPVFQKIVDITKARGVDTDNYTFFMIITDGVIHDFQETANLLVKAAELPMSIVIIGVGNEDFEIMRRLDSGDVVDSSGKKPSRDICHFTKFDPRTLSGEALRKEILTEIPKQIVEYYEKKGIAPKPPQVGARSFVRSFNNPGNRGAGTTALNPNTVIPTGNVLISPQADRAPNQLLVPGAASQPPAGGAPNLPRGGLAPNQIMVTGVSNQPIAGAIPNQPRPYAPPISVSFGPQPVVSAENNQPPPITELTMNQLNTNYPRPPLENAP